MCLKAISGRKSSRWKEPVLAAIWKSSTCICMWLCLSAKEVHWFGYECYINSFQSHLVYSFCFILKEQIHSDHFIYGWENWTLTDCSPRRNCLVLELQVIVKLPYASGEKVCPWLGKQVGGGRRWEKLCL